MVRLLRFPRSAVLLAVPVRVFVLLLLLVAVAPRGLLARPDAAPLEERGLAAAYLVFPPRRAGTRRGLMDGGPSRDDYEGAPPVEGAGGTKDDAGGGPANATAAANARAPFSVQPRVTVVEGLPSRCAIASISNPAGTPWCQGAPTYWVTGHQFANVRPRCQRDDGAWVVSNTTELNHTRDRHYCVTMDVNRDGLVDIICNVGAGNARGKGYNELWITDATGSVTQLLNASSDNPYESPSGLQKYPTMRNRIAVTLRNEAGEDSFVFMGTLGFPRPDGMPNQHRMFKNVYTAPLTFPYFVEVPGPWTRQLFPATCAVSGDFSGDQVDDLVVCNNGGPALLARQVGATESFVRVHVPANQSLVRGWRNARLADVTGDGRKDLVVLVDRVAPEVAGPQRLIVFRGVAASPYFDFALPYYRRQLPHFGYDVEVLDVNRDGRADIYVLQMNTTRGAYCGPQAVGVVRLPPDVVPPLDTAPDLLFLGGPVGAEPPQKRFQVVKMVHAQPGCAAFAQRWSRRTMLLAQGSGGRSGYQLLLEW